jgi:hypothetical protein
MAETPEFDAQDLAEVWDEDNQAPDGMRMNDDQLNADTNPDVYDATRAVGDEDDDDAMIGEDMEDADIVELSLDGEDADLEDDGYTLRQGDALDDEDDDELDFDDDDADMDDKVARLSPGEVELEDAGDLGNAYHAEGSAKRFESSRLSDDQIDRLGYGEGGLATSTTESKSFDPATGRTPEEHAKHAKQDELLDEGVEETFPASDPVSVKHIT